MYNTRFYSLYIKFNVDFYMNKFGVLVPNLGPTQLAYQFINSANMYSNQADIIAFYEDIGPQSFPLNFASMFIDQAYYYKEPLIATNISTAMKLLDFPCCPTKFFYCWDLEWARISPNSRKFKVLYNIYNNPELNILARSESHALQIQKCWNVKRVNIVKNFNIEQILCIITGYVANSQKQS